jgi:hypothetical protein
MTSDQYYRLYKQARSQSALISLRAQVELRSLYIKASKQAADKLKDALNPGKRELSESEWNELSRQLKDAKLTLTDGITAIAVATVAAGAILYPKVNAAYLKANIKSESITDSGLDKLASVQTRRAVESMSTRTYGTGKAFSTRVWGAKDDWEASIRKIVEEGIKIGRDPAKIAKDIQVYTADGRVALANRWAQIERGTPGWYNRLPKNLDWRGVRLIRSELQASIQQAEIISGEENPGGTGKYKWLLGPGLNHCDTCLGYSTQIFTKETIPSYPHSNCGCVAELILRDRAQFVKDLKSWESGDINADNRYIDQWYTNIYQPAQGK